MVSRAHVTMGMGRRQEIFSCRLADHVQLRNCGQQEQDFLPAAESAENQMSAPCLHGRNGGLQTMQDRAGRFCVFCCRRDSAVQEPLTSVWQQLCSAECFVFLAPLHPELLALPVPHAHCVFK
jgi:hypothetical protein